ncbi:serine hydrolase RBBP9-like [Gigantopelta aegis]|uniref:serine hydrolase RBBP9-like n=1 Tax=Gigantopelta aegis TaxID=1735272 RepID=UPI001B889539|nr:serine hydrolase RBBP9-like [Gigantopelta aegis]XP_041371749.1 serine hydrolase RBBP9-like [Gigantopelta aegis]
MTSACKVAIVPANGCYDVYNCFWYGWLHKQLTQSHVHCVLRSMPEPDIARESIWIPFMRNDLECDEQTIIVGHVLGAEAAMRFAEKYKVKGIVLVSACVTDLGIARERESGYFDRPWKWVKIKSNTDFVMQFGSKNDPIIPWKEQERIADALNVDLHIFKRGHFMTSTFPELLELIISKVKIS